MNDHIKMLFADNLDIVETIEEFCAQDPDYLRIKQAFYETAHEIASVVGYDLYNRFEHLFGRYVACSSDIYYLFGLGLRQEVIAALQSEIS